MTYEHINVKRTHGAGGGLVWGINCSKKLPDKIVNELRNAWLEYGVLFFEHQKLTDEEFMQFGEQFGDLFVNENYT